MSDPRERVQITPNPGGGPPSVRRVTITAEEERRLISQGHEFADATPQNVATAEQSTASDELRRVGELQSPLAVAATSAVNTATAGALAADVSEATREVQQSAAAASPLADIGGGALGAFAGLPGLGGATQVGRLAGRAISSRLGQRLVTGGVEGIFGGAAEGIAQANINDEELGEHLMANMGLGALFGLGFEGIAGGLGSVFRPAQRAVGDAAEATGQGFLGRTHRRLSSILSVDTGDIDGLPLQEHLRRAAPIEENGGIRRFSSDIADDFTEAVRAGDASLGDLEHQRFISSDRVRSGLREVDDAARDALTRDLGSVYVGFDDLARVGRSEVRAGASEIQQAIRGVSLEGDASQIMSSIFDARRRISAVAESALPDSELRARALGALEQLDQSTGSLFGDGGQAFARRGKVFDDLLRARDDLKAYIGQAGGESTINASQLQAAFEKAFRAGDETGIARINQFLTAQQNADDLLRSVGVEPKHTADIAAIQQRMGERLEQFKSFRAVQDAAVQENNQSGLASSLGIGGGGVVGAALGFGVGGPIGAAIGGLSSLAVSAVSRPVSFQRAAFRASRALGRNSARATTAMRTFDSAVRSKERVPKSGLRIPKGGLAAVLYNGTRQDRQKEYEQLANRVEELMANPDTFANLLSTSPSDLHHLSPGLVPSIAQNAHRAASILAGHLPPARLNQLNRLAMQSTEIPASQSEVDGFLEVAAVIEDPFFGVDLMNAGRLSPNAAGAMRQMYPRLHSEMTAALGSSVARRRAAGGSVNYQALIRFSNFAGVPLDATLEPDFLLAMQDQSAQTTAQEQATFARPVSTRRPSAFSGGAMSMTQALESDR